MASLRECHRYDGEHAAAKDAKRKPWQFLACSASLAVLGALGCAPGRLHRRPAHANAHAPAQPNQYAHRNAHALADRYAFTHCHA